MSCVIETINYSLNYEGSFLHNFVLNTLTKQFFCFFSSVYEMMIGREGWYVFVQFSNHKNLLILRKRLLMKHQRKFGSQVF